MDKGRAHGVALLLTGNRHHVGGKDHYLGCLCLCYNNIQANDGNFI